MPLPRFEKDSNSVSFDKNETLPIAPIYDAGQRQGATLAGTIKVRTPAYTRTKAITLNFVGISDDVGDAVITFFEAIKYKVNSFTFIDSHGERHTVRLMNNEIALPHFTADTVSVAFQLRVE